MTDAPFSWVIYKNPPEYPEAFVARRYVRAKPTEGVVISLKLEKIRAKMEDMRLRRVPRNPGDDPAILEIWI